MIPTWFQKTFSNENQKKICTSTLSTTKDFLQQFLENSITCLYSDLSITMPSESTFFYLVVKEGK